MKFGPLPVAEAVGAILAHSLKLGSTTLKKGLRLTQAHVAELAAAGIRQVTAAQLEVDDSHEDAAAEAIAAAIAPDPRAAHLNRSAPFTGRANLFAAAAGVLRVDAAAVAAVNAIDEAITLATLPDYARVAPRQMAATVKIIPYGAPEKAVREAAAQAAGAIRVAPFRPRPTRLILTKTPGMKDSVVDKGAVAVRQRLLALGGADPAIQTAPHEPEALAEALVSAEEELLLVLAGSATSDRRDVAPAAITQAGGRIERLGMPVDPGNLLVLGALGDRPVLGLPGCARSPKLNGVDWVLERIIADLPVDAADIAAMGVGGLLKEIPSRPEPRAGGGEAPRRPIASGVLLAAGGSHRMGAGRHKLLEKIGGAPLIRRSAERLLESALDEVVVVIGARSQEMRAALQGLELRIVENPTWERGMAGSLAVGLAAIRPDADAALIALADMPDVSSRLVDRLLAGFDPGEGRAIIRPTAGGRPGHPVLFGRRFFEELRALDGDVGARSVVAGHADYVADVAVEEEGAFTDLDTPDAWAAWRARPRS